MTDNYQTMEIGEFCSDLNDILETDKSVRFVFFLGAGCSLSSGIPLADDLARTWLLKLVADKPPLDDESPDVASWVNKRFKGALESPAAHYAEISRVRFRNDPRRQQTEIERLTANKFPGHGYALLAQLICSSKFAGRTNVVLTTNFDDLLTDALYLYTDKRPLVLVHENLFEFVIISPDRPLIVKLHGDAHIDPKNNHEQIADQTVPIRKVLQQIPKDAALIFIGYGGWDQSTTSALLECDDGEFRRGIYWINNKRPPETWEPLWNGTKRNCYWVQHLDFDALMITLAEALDITSPHLERSRYLRREHHKTLASLDYRLSRHSEMDIARKVLNKRLDFGREVQLADLTDWVADELLELNEDERARLFVKLADKPAFHTSIRRALASCPTPISQATVNEPQTEVDLEQRILADENDGPHYLQLAKHCTSTGDFTKADTYLQKARRDESLNCPADLIGTEAYLRAFTEVGTKTCALFERAYVLDPHHRLNLLRHLKVMLSVEQWAGLGPVDIWRRGKEMLDRFFDLPEDGTEPSLRFDALYCAAAFYAQTFQHMLKNEEWLSCFADGSLQFGSGRQFLEAIAARADSADPDDERGWAHGSGIEDAQFGDKETLLSELSRVEATQV